MLFVIVSTQLGSSNHKNQQIGSEQVLRSINQILKLISEISHFGFDSSIHADDRKS